VAASGAPRGLGWGRGVKLVVAAGERIEEATVEHRAGRWHITLGARVYEVDAAGRGALRSLVVDGRQHEVAVRARPEGVYQVSVAGEHSTVILKAPLAYLAEQAHGAQDSGKQTVVAYMPGVVKRILVEEGQEITRGQPLAVLEAMKMDNQLDAEAGGIIEKILVEEGQAVDGGQVLFEIA